MTSKLARAGAGVALLLMTGLPGAMGCSSPAESTAPPPAARATTPPPAYATALQSQIAPDLPMLPANINLGARPAEVVRAAYEFAARHPEVLRYVPCFCGCERGGHQGNDDCFVGTRDKGGKVTEWTTHGLICEVCIDLAQQAMQMHNSGASLVAIRAAVEQRYAGSSTHTPTPMPPVKGAKGA